jgi:hypothetical protein
MNLIQIVLVVSVLLSVYTYLTRLRSQLADRLLVILVGASALVLVIVPNISSKLAHIFGVGRGVDFLFYLAHAGIILVVIILYSKLRAQSEWMTELARIIAIQNVRIAPDPSKESSDVFPPNLE